jgi:hypothetical protein
MEYVAFLFYIRFLHLFVNNLVIPYDLSQIETIKRNNEKQKETIDCASTQTNARSTKHSPTSSFSKAYKPCLPTDENQLRYNGENITLSSSHCNPLPTNSRKAELPHLRNVTSGRFLPHLTVMV